MFVLPSEDHRKNIQSRVNQALDTNKGILRRAEKTIYFIWAIESALIECLRTGHGRRRLEEPSKV